MYFNIDNHPYLKTLLEDKLYSITKSENLKVFIISSEELNKGVINYSDLSLGKYIWTKDKEYLKSCNELLYKVKEFENSYGTSINEYRSKMGIELFEERNYYYPRIELADKQNKSSFSKIYFYKTFAHEIGHHISVTKNNDSSEESADNVAKDIISELPNYFKCIFWYLFEDLTFKQKILYNIEFIKYYFKCKKLTAF